MVKTVEAVWEDKTIKVYVAGPLTSSGSVAANIKQASDMGFELMKWGHSPYVPHVMYIWECFSDDFAGEYERWMELDFSWLSVCDALIRLPGESKGADREVEYANKNFIRVFHTLWDFLRWADELEMKAEGPTLLNDQGQDITKEMTDLLKRSCRD